MKCKYLRQKGRLIINTWPERGDKPYYLQWSGKRPRSVEHYVRVCIAVVGTWYMYALHVHACNLQKVVLSFIL